MNHDYSPNFVTVMVVVFQALLVHLVRFFNNYFFEGSISTARANCAVLLQDEGRGVNAAKVFARSMVNAPPRGRAKFVYHGVPSSVALSFGGDVVTRTVNTERNAVAGGEGARPGRPTSGALENFLINFLRGLPARSTFLQDRVGRLFVVRVSTWPNYRFFSSLFSTATRLATSVSSVVAVRDAFMC